MGMFAVIVRHAGLVLLDCAPTHLGEAVLRVAQERGLYICFVPAGCTAEVKAFLKRARDVCPKGFQSRIGCWPSTKLRQSFCVEGAGLPYTSVE